MLYLHLEVLQVESSEEVLVSPVLGEDAVKL